MAATVPIDYGEESTEVEPVAATEPANGPRSSQRSIRYSNYYGFPERAEVAVNNENTDFSITEDHFACTVYEINEPENFDEATKSPHAKEWKCATDLEHQSLVENHTWDLVNLPECKSTVGCKWVFKVKYNEKAGSRVDWLQKGTRNDMGLTLSRHLHQLFVIH